GSTAIECCGGLKAAGAAAEGAAGAAGAAAGACFSIPSLVTPKYVRAATTTTAIPSSRGLDDEVTRTDVPPTGAALDAALAVGRVIVAASGDTKRCTRSTKAGGVSPPGRRVHWTPWNFSGTEIVRSGVPSITTGTRKAFLSAMSPARSTANLHSR